MPRKPPCPPDEVENPETHFCVKVSGKIGQRLIKEGKIMLTNIKDGLINKNDKKAKPIKTKLVNNNKINNQSNVDIKNKDNNGHRTIEEKVNFKDTNIILKKGKATIEVQIEKNLKGYYCILAIGSLPKRLLKKNASFESNNLDDIVVKYNEFLQLFLENHYKIHDVKGNIDWLTTSVKGKLCMLSEDNTIVHQTTQTFDISKCKNNTTMYNLDNLSTKDINTIIMVSTNRCYIIDEIAQSIISQGLKDPLSPNESLSDKDLIRIVSHPHLSDNLRSQLKDKFDANKKLLKQLETLYKSKQFLVTKILRVLLITGLLCKIDFTDDKGFLIATDALMKCETFLDKLSVEIGQLIYSLQVFGGNDTFRDILNSVGSTCIHALGSKIMFFALQYINKLGCLDALPHDYIYRIPGQHEDYVFLYPMCNNTSDMIYANEKDLSGDMLVLEGFTFDLENTPLYRLAYILNGFKRRYYENISDKLKKYFKRIYIEHKEDMLRYFGPLMFRNHNEGKKPYYLSGLQGILSADMK